jgi:N-acetylglutamate synthase-like GNAT family acetyltransferase
MRVIFLLAIFTEEINKMVQLAKPFDSTEILRLIGSIFPKGNMVRYGDSVLEKNISSGKYLSVVSRDRGHIVAHAGILISSGVATLNSLVVDKDYRGFGLGKKMAEERLLLCDSLKDITHVAVYSSLHNTNSQRYLDNSFKPVGICVSRGNPFSLNDPFNQPTSYYWEIALSKSKNNCSQELNLKYCPSNIKGIISDIFYSIDLKDSAEISFPRIESPSKFLGRETESISLYEKNVRDRVRSLQEEGYFFSGVLPNAITGIHEIGFIKRDLTSSLCQIKTTQIDRENFVKQMLSK